MARWVGLALLALGLGCASQGANPPRNAEVEKLFDRVTSDTAALIARNEQCRIHGVDEQTWTIDVWYLPTGPEKALRELGAEAVTRLILAIEEPHHPLNEATFQRLLAQVPVPESVGSEDPQKRDLDPEYWLWKQRVQALKQPDHPLYRATYLRILSQVRSSAAGQTAFRVLGREKDERVVTECLRVLGLLGDCRYADALRKLFSSPGVRLKRLLWTLAMVGDQRAADDLLTLVEGLVRIRPLVPLGGLNNPVPEIPSAVMFAHVLQPDDPVDLARDLADDLTDISRLKNTKVVRILIEGLSSHRKQILHTCEALLEDILDLDLRRQPGTHWHQPGALYSLKTYQGMREWWEAAGRKLRWSDEKLKFVLISN